MVVRILRDGILRPSKFPKPKFSALHCIQRSTTSDLPPDDVARCKECQRIIDTNDITRPTLYIAHTTVFDTGKDDNAGTETLLESLQRKLASQTRPQQNLANEAQKNEASGEVTAETNSKGDDCKHSLQADNVWYCETINENDINKENKLLQRTERIEDRGETEVIVDQPNLKPSHARYQFKADTQMIDELAKKYLNMQRDLIDKRLSQDMECLGLPFNFSEAMSPYINVNVSCEENTQGAVHQVNVPKPENVQQRGVINTNLQYYEELNWCNLYFNSPRENESKITSTDKDGTDLHKAYVKNPLIEEMLPLHCCLDFDLFDKSNETSISVEKLGFEKHDDNIPFHQLQCMEFIDLDLRVINDKIECPIDNLNVEEGLPNHLYLQENLVNDFDTAPNTIKSIGLYDFTTPFDESDLVGNIPKEHGVEICHSLVIPDMDVTKFDYAFPRDTEATYTLNSIFKIPESQTNDTSELAKGAGTILQVQSQTIPNIEKEQIQKKEQADHTDILQKMKIETDDITFDKNEPNNPYQNPKTEAELRNFISTKIMDQIGALKNVHATKQFNEHPTQEDSSEKLTKLIHTKVLEQVIELRTLERTTHSLKDDAIVQTQPPEVIHNIQPTTENKVIKDDASQKVEATVKSSNQAQPIPIIQQNAAQIDTPQTNVLKSHDNKVNLADTVGKVEELKHPSRGTGTIVQSCVQTAPNNAQKVAPEPLSIPKAVEDVANKLTLDLNLSFSELLRRVRTYNRLQYLQEQIKIMSRVNAEKRCPPSDRPQCPPPPQCVNPCPPPSKPKCPPPPPLCPPPPPVCPPDPPCPGPPEPEPKCPCPPPPKCPPPPPKCPPPRCPPKCPPDPPKCPPDPPKCPPEPKCPCPCPPPPRCPPPPPKCPPTPPKCCLCTSTNPEEHVTTAPHFKLLDATTTYLRSTAKRIMKSIIPLENTTLYLNRSRDFEPWTPIPSWPFPVHEKKKNAQCPYHGCPFPKPGPVRPNCPELPCAGFPKLHNKQMVKRDFSKTAWTKPKHIDKRRTERCSHLTSAVQNSCGHKAAWYVELSKAWLTIENELFNAFAKNNTFSATCSFSDPKNNSGKNKNMTYDISKDDDSKKGHEDPILQAYSEFRALISAKVGKSNIELLKAPTQELEATLNATTKNLEEEKLTQKLEAIEEVPLVEADPDIIKPPSTSGPAVMNTSSHDYEDRAKNSDFQIGDDTTDRNLQANEENRNLINIYFEREDFQKPLNDLISLSAVPEIKSDGEMSLTELMHRVRTRNRLLRCRDINHQLNATRTEDPTMDHGRSDFPQHQHPQAPPGWSWPMAPQHHPPRNHPFPRYPPTVANPGPQKAEPITPDSRPGYNRASKVNPVTLALYLGPLVSAFRNASVLFPLLAACVIPSFSSANDLHIHKAWCVLPSTYEKDSEESAAAETRDYD